MLTRPLRHFEAVLSALRRAGKHQAQKVPGKGMDTESPAMIDPVSTGTCMRFDSVDPVFPVQHPDVLIPT